MDPRGYSGGLALFWKKSVAVDVVYADKNIVDCRVQLGSTLFYISFIYGDPVIKYRSLVWERLTRIGIHRKESWSIVGDFNDLLHNGEKVGGPCREEAQFQPFVDMIKACDMCELPCKGNALTWGGMRYKIWVQC